jgi:apolipoprotein N-acyltransferase
MIRAASILPASRSARLALAATAGVATVLGFAPARLYLLPVFTVAFLILLWRHSARARDAAWLGLAFGLGLFLGGVSWVYVSLHDFGAMPAWLAAFVTLLFCFYLALYPAATGAALLAFGRRSAAAMLIALPALWMLGEWLRGWFLTGFPWLAIGYTQVPASPLAGYLPVAGVYGTTLLTVLSAALLIEIVECAARRYAFVCGAVLAATWAGGYALQGAAWTQAEGNPVTVSLLQGNVSQDLKWREDRIRTTLDTYRDLVLATDARLVILPETALPLFYNDVPTEYLESLADHVRRHRGDLLIGMPERGRSGDYYNSVLSFGASPTQVYRKSHLVPFGEFVPLKPLLGWFIEAVSIPLLDFSRGTETQPPLQVAGLRVGMNVCYEDAFGNEIIRQLPQATVLVNVSNVAWFGHSIAPSQHLQIAQARAMETGRPMLRATNTGMTAIIDPHGNVQADAPQFETAIVRGQVRAYHGSTPYVRWGNGPVIGIALVLLAVAAFIARKAARDAGRVPAKGKREVAV